MLHLDRTSRNVGQGREAQTAADADGPENANKKKKELERLMKLIDKLESQAQKLEAEMAAEGFYDGDQSDVEAVLKKMEENRLELNAAYEAWEILEQDED